MREDFLTDREHFYLNNPATLNVHPPDRDPAHAAYLNALHDVHQLYGYFSDDDDNDYYPDDHAQEVLIPQPLDVVTDVAFGPMASDSSQEFPDSQSAHVADDESHTPVDGKGHDAFGDGGQVFEPNPDPKEIDVVVITSSDEEA
ncbi:hypothetical protein MKW92_024480 [Papaver armeniacum]|nr:hypothetical protein MKW92_024480 [Papaver armeniacum]